MEDIPKSFYTRREVATEYGIDIKTFKENLKRVGYILPKGKICPKVYDEIKEILGEPKG